MISLFPSKEYKFKQILFAGGYSGVVLLVRNLISLFFSRQRDVSQYAVVDSSAMVFIVYSVVAFGVAYNDIKKDSNRIGSTILFHTPMVILFLYTVYGAFTMLWSVNLQLTGYRSFECMAMLMLIVATIQNLFKSQNNETVFQWSVFYIAYQAMTKIIEALAWTTNIGELLQRSQMESTCFFFIALYATRKCWRHYLILLMSIFSMSTTAYIGMALGLLSMYKVKVTRGVKLLIFVATIVLGLVVLIVGPQKFLMNTVFIDREEISIENTSGRNHIMEVVLESSASNPMGLGFFAGEPYILYFNDLAAINGHNSFFSAALGTGIPGVILLLLFFFGVGSKIMGRRIPPSVLGPLFGCFFVAFIHCMGNPGLGSRVYGGWIPTVYIFTLICAYVKYGEIENCNKIN